MLASGFTASCLDASKALEYNSRMITTVSSWSLGACPNKSLNCVEPPVPPLQGDPFFLHGRIAYIHHCSLLGSAPFLATRLPCPFVTISSLFVTLTPFKNLLYSSSKYLNVCCLQHLKPILHSLRKMSYRHNSQTLVMRSLAFPQASIALSTTPPQRTDT